MKTMGVKQGVFFLQFSTTKGRRVPLAEKKYPLHQVPMKNMNIKLDERNWWQNIWYVDQFKEG